MKLFAKNTKAAEMFEYLGNTLCVQGGWLYKEAGIISHENYKILCHRGRIKVVRRGCRNTPALVEFDSLPGQFRDLIVERYGIPQEVVGEKTLVEEIEADQKAIEYYNEYRLSEGSALPENTKSEYIVSAAILNAVGKIVSKRAAARAVRGGGKKGLWDQMAGLVSELPQEVFPHRLPRNAGSLRKKHALYKKLGYEALIHKSFANRNSQKVGEQAKIWLLSRWADRVDKVANLTEMFRAYNREAQAQGWKTLKDEKTIYNFLYDESVKSLWWGHRYGELKSKEKYSYQHSTKLPGVRDALWYSDGTKLNYFFQYSDKDGKIKRGTVQVYEVVDAFSEMLLGYHISPTEDHEAQYAAYKMALEVSGHKPYQLAFDHQGGHGKLKNKEFLSKMARITVKTQPYNGKSKTIENLFARFQGQFLKKDWFFTGQNITAKREESKVNMEFILANGQELPTLEEVKKLYAQRRKEWNEAVHPLTGLPREQMYRESKNDQAPAISFWDMVDMFWVLREKPVTFNAFGLTFREKGVKYTYSAYDQDGLPDMKWIEKNIDKKFHIKFDPDDMRCVRVYEDKGDQGLVFAGELLIKTQVHRALQEHEAGEMEFIQKVQEKARQTRIERRDKMDEILEKYQALPQRHGLRSPSLAGLNEKKRRRNNIGMHSKKQSNLTADHLEDFDAVMEAFEMI